MGPLGAVCLTGLPAALTAAGPGGGGRAVPLSVPCRAAPVTPWLPLSTDGKGRQPQGGKGRAGRYPRLQSLVVTTMAGGGGRGVWDEGIVGLLSPSKGDLMGEG